MNKIAVFAVLAIFVMAVYADDPVLPKKSLCSIQGTGKVTYFDTYERYSGTVSMKRVNQTAVYNMDLKDDISGKTGIKGTILIRIDLRHTMKKIKGEGINGESDSNKAIYLSNYKYNKDYKPIADKQYHAFTVVDKYGGEMEAAMLFSADDKMSLIGEVFYFAQGDNNVTMVYDEVKDYDHSTVDHVFSIDDFEQYSLASTDAPWALSIACLEDQDDSASVFFPSFILLILAAIALAIF